MRNWQREQCAPRTNPTYEGVDGSEQIPLSLEQPACTSEFEAQRKGEFMNRRSRNQVALVGILPPRFRFVCAGDVGAFTFPEIGWFSKNLRILTASLLPDSSIQVGIAEEQSTDWTDLAASEYGTQSAAVLPPNNPTTPSEATLTIASVINGSLRFTMSGPITKPRDTRYRIITSINCGNAAVGSAIYDGVTQQIDLPAPLGIQNFYWAQCYADSYVGPYSPNTYGMGAVASYWDTAQLAGNAATEIITQVVSLTSVTSIPGGALTISSYQVGPYPYDTKVINTVTGDYDVAVTTPASFLALTVKADFFSGTRDGNQAAQLVLNRASISSIDLVGAFTREAIVTLPMSQSNTAWGIIGGTLAPGVTLKINNLTQKLEVIKR
jgi:hypothetical protein